MALKDLEERYVLELDKIVETINDKKVKKVLLQLPDGLKIYALDIVNYLEKRCDANISIYLGSCFGSCDVPTTNADLVVQFGHAPWS